MRLVSISQKVYEMEKSEMLNQLIHKAFKAVGYKRNNTKLHKAKQSKAKTSSTDDIVFLHIGKTGGTQIGSLIDQLNTLQKLKIGKYHHSYVLADVPKDQGYFFSIRKPVSRFQSAFYSRKRMGVPLHNNEWSEKEAKAFGDFESANDLAESLFESNAYGTKAYAAMHSIGHLKSMQSRWFKSDGYFLEQRPPVWIIRQEHLEKDFSDFLLKANLEVTMDKLEIVRDPSKAHIFNYEGIPALSEKAIRNLEAWYSVDIAFYNACEAWIESSQK